MRAGLPTAVGNPARIVAREAGAATSGGADAAPDAAAQPMTMED